MLGIILQVASTIILLTCLTVYVIVNYMRPRAKPLNNSELLEVTIMIQQMTTFPIKLHLPSETFVNNMSAAIDRHLSDVKRYWFISIYVSVSKISQIHS